MIKVQIMPTCQVCILGCIYNFLVFNDNWFSLILASFCVFTCVYVCACNSIQWYYICLYIIAWKNGWQVISPKKSFAVFAATKTEKEEWMAHIRKCIKDLLAKGMWLCDNAKFLEKYNQLNVKINAHLYRIVV